MDRRKFKKPIQEASPKEIIVAFLGAIGLVIALVLCDKLLPDDIRSIISILTPFLVIMCLLIFPKKERNIIEEKTTSLKRTKIGKFIIPFVFGALFLIAFIAVRL